MTVAIISDIHGNLIALQQCLDNIDKRPVDEIICLGDCVGYFPDYNKTLDLIRERTVTCLLGNHEAMLLEILPLDNQKDKIYRIAESRKELSVINIAFLKTLIPFHIAEFRNKKLLFVHGSPFNPLNEYMSSTFDFSRIENLGFDYLFCGHTHIPFIKEFRGVKVINVGSCGLPREDGRFGSYAIFDTERERVELVQFELDLSAIALRYKNEVDVSVFNVLNRRKVG